MLLLHIVDTNNEYLFVHATLQNIITIRAATLMLAELDSPNKQAFLNLPDIEKGFAAYIKNIT